MTINVTYSHIINGHREDCTRCPITLALRDAGLTKATSGNLSVSGIPGRPAFPLPESARKFIRRFDEGHSVEPFSFELDL